jgi:Zn-finger nucleic acid-binding protein
MGTINEGPGDTPAVAYCDQCKGTWYAKGELAELLGVTDENPVLVAGWRHELALVAEIGPPCPACESEALRDVPFTPDLSVTMLGCDACHGAFVEAGSVPRIKSLVLREVHSSRPPAAASSSRRPPR